MPSREKGANISQSLQLHRKPQMYVYLFEGITAENVVMEVKSLFGQYQVDEVEAGEYITRFNLAFNAAHGIL